MGEVEYKEKQRRYKLQEQRRSDLQNLMNNSHFVTKENQGMLDSEEEDRN